MMDYTDQSDWIDYNEWVMDNYEPIDPFPFINKCERKEDEDEEQVQETIVILIK